MTDNIEENFKKTLYYCEKAKECDLLFFPEIQHSPFFSQYEKRNVNRFFIKESDEKIKCIA